MRGLIAAIALTAFCVSSALADPPKQTPAAPADALRLTPGEAVTLQFDSDMATVTITERGPGQLSQSDADSAQRLAAGEYGNATGRDYATVPVRPGEAPPPPVAPNAVRLTFVELQGTNQSVLLIENGYDLALNYRARMSASGHDQPTDVCQVAPNHRGFENWPYHIDQLDLSSFRLTPFTTGDRLVCE